MVPNGRLSNRTVLVGLILVLMVVAIQAAPILPQCLRLANEIRCLATISKVSIEIEPLPQLLLDAGVSSGRLEGVIRARLKAASIEVSQEDVMPRLVLKCVVVTDPAMPDAIAVILFLDVQQKVDLLRLNKQMVLPTATLLGSAQTKRDGLAFAALRECASATKMFIHYSRLATKELEEAR